MLQFIKRYDWYLNGALLFLATASLVMLASVNNQQFFWFQLAWVVVAFAIIALFSQIDWRPIISYRWAILGGYLSVTALLILTLLIAPAIRGSRSWLPLGPFQFQTSELAKFALIILLAAFFAKRHLAIARLHTIIISFLYAAVFLGLILLQPDLGSALIVGGIWLGFLLVSGIPWRYLLVGLVIFSLLAFAGWNFFLKDYQKDRVIGLFNPTYDPLGVNYNVIQSKIAIGSGGWLGKGFGQGTQVQLGFLPEVHADFIFAALIEEWGLVGGVLVLAAFLLVMARIIRIGILADNNFYKLLSLGTVIMFLLQLTLNVGSNLGLLPVVGVSFPFLSQGGSNLLINAMLVGILESITINQ